MSQSMLEDDEAMSVSQDAFGKIRAVSDLTEHKATLTDIEDFSGPLEQRMMQPLSATVPTSGVEYIESYMLNSV